MPRKAPTNITEHRITFGQYERERLNELQNSVSFAQYTSPLKSPFVAVGLAGGLGYLGLAYAFEWWPFEPKKSWFTENDFYKKTTAFMQAAKECNSASIVEQINAEKLQEFEDSIAAAKQFIADNPNPSSMFKRMAVRAAQMKVKDESDLRQIVINSNEERLQKAQAMDAKCAARKADEQTEKWYD